MKGLKDILMQVLNVNVKLHLSRNYRKFKWRSQCTFLIINIKFIIEIIQANKSQLIGKVCLLKFIYLYIYHCLVNNKHFCKIIINLTNLTNISHFASAFNIGENIIYFRFVNYYLHTYSSLYFIECTSRNYLGGKEYHIIVACNRTSDHTFTINQTADCCNET